MNQLCRRALMVALGVALLSSAPLRTLQAQNAEKPAVIVSLANVDKLLDDVGYLTRAAGTPEIGGLVTLMAGQYIEGLDTKKPAGMFLTMSGQQPSGIAFIGVSDFDQVLTKIEEAVGEPEDVGEGVKKLALQRNVFFKESNGWIYIADSAANLDRAPANPDTLLGALPSRYNVAVQVNVQQIPEPLRQMAISELRDGFERGLEAQGDPDQKAMQEQIGRNGIENLVQFIEGADQLTFGWGVDSEEGATFIDFAVTAVPGTELAEQFAAIEKTTTNFAGFDIPEAAAVMQFTSPISEDDIEQATVMLQAMKKEALKEIENDDDLPNDASRQAAKDVVTQLMAVLEETIKSGKIDGGGALLLQDSKLRFVAGGYLADGKAVEQSLKKLVEISAEVDDDVKLEDVRFNVEQHRGVDLHTMLVPIPEDEEEARNVLGEQFTIVVGTSQESLYVALGQDSMELLKQVIDRSAEAGETEIPPLTLRVALQPILEFASALDDDPKIKRIAEVLQQANGKDTVSLQAASIPRGAGYRFKVEEGVLQVIGQAIRMQNGP